MSAAQQIITVDDIGADNAPAIYVAGGLRRFIDATKAQVESEVPDLTTRKGRERIASLAAQVSRSKTAVEKPGRDYLKRLKEMPKVVEGELREFVQEMDALRDQVRQPLNEWEAADVARRDRHTDRIDWLRNRDDELVTLSVADIKARITEAESVELGPQWEEFEAEAAREKDKVLTTLRAGLIKREEYDAQQAESARLRAEAEAREKADREAAIAREAAERATKEAELKAERERQAEAQRVSDEKAAAKCREFELKLQAEQAERQAAQSEANRIAAEQRAEQERVAALKRAEQAAEQARIDERRRADAAAAEIVRQQELREADKAHKAKINRAALDAFIAGGMPEACAKQAVTLIAQRKIPNINIQY
ncbi:hypothetical protein ASF84_05205 [Pseudomonas sp. Leaf127]|uniref:hypothetical protein n=1 Tax=Pseudomonas sp. Leaf127 TaxID=1736267 RepID=UPI000702720A|nr:hypothetical protein [Pseudomonas sp. Leaf127]KQQ60110.1 hypothetical protein ASF84_05205 [Pseudomonas sp. Leaf127]